MERKVPNDAQDYMEVAAHDTLCAPRTEGKNKKKSLRYSSELLRIAEIDKFFQRKHKAGEGVNDYTTALRNLAINPKFRSYLDKSMLLLDCDRKKSKADYSKLKTLPYNVRSILLQALD